MIPPTLSITEASKIKGCSRQTIYTRRKDLDWHEKRIIYNKRFRDFETDHKKGRRKK